jgi:hypothetical protein
VRTAVRGSSVRFSPISEISIPRDSDVPCDTASFQRDDAPPWRDAVTERERKARAPRSKIPGHTPEPEFAEELGVKRETLRKWRRQGKGPAYVRVAQQIHYVDDDKPRWLALLRVTPPRSGRAQA